MVNRTLLRKAGREHQAIMSGVVAFLHSRVHSLTDPLTTMDLEVFIDGVIEQKGYSAPFKGVADYGFASCICVNEEIVHARPSSRIIHPGDLVDIDFGIKIVFAEHDSVIVDAARTIVAGSKEKHPLIEYTEAWRDAMIARCQIGAKVLDLAEGLKNDIPNPNGYAIFPGYPGHGIGQDNLHVSPLIPSTPVGDIPTYWWEHRVLRENYALKENDVVAIEPIAVANPPKKWSGASSKDPDGWREFMVNGALSAHAEHTILITKDGPEIIA